jgi:hypothetical protein
LNVDAPLGYTNIWRISTTESLSAALGCKAACAACAVGVNGLISTECLVSRRVSFSSFASFLGANLLFLFTAMAAAQQLYVFFSAIGDAPEHILEATVDLSKPWQQWKAEHPVDLLTSERSYECANLPALPSRAGDINEPVPQLRDPAIYEEAGRVYLLYSTCGEQGIALAEVHLR